MQSFESWGFHDEAQVLKYYTYITSTSAPILSVSPPTADCSPTTTSAEAPLTLDLATLEKRITELESKMLIELETPGRRGGNDECVSRVYDEVKSLKQYSSLWTWVPKTYYKLSLPERSKILRTTVPQLCKSMLMENKSFKDTNSNSQNSRFYLVVVQYCSSIDVKKLEGEVRGLLPVKDRLTSKDYTFSVAKETDSDDLTGFKHNSVSPFGLCSKIPVILDKSIAHLETPFFWMGGGHPDLKLGMSVNDFLKAGGIVCDIDVDK
ncbi:hypothetical protein TL16_g03883 [Triparma laevis f. inornata]|uniref:YbaK/aminoacyl-tRNA synthetase-associated domain-containing protein n=1 Tax=Triparma laevis f. inornata TaxID=1714386 RepID=A0A9W7E2R6_9STRA|nr:hypothetical protein TL16_g03883 [Triparma laevis f. inornata]